jgi:hypothetical protein
MTSQHSRILLALIALVLLATSAQAQKTPKPTIPAGSKVYLAKMEGELDGFVSAQILKKKLPVTLVTDEAVADFIMTGGAVKGIHKWYDTVITGGERDRNQGNVKIVSVKEKTVIWAGEAGDRSFWWGALKKGGTRKVAERIVNKMKEQIVFTK